MLSIVKGLRLQVKLKISEICSLLDVDGIRGDIVTNRAARALVALEGRDKVSMADVKRVISICVNHRWAPYLSSLAWAFLCAVILASEHHCNSIALNCIPKRYDGNVWQALHAVMICSKRHCSSIALNCIVRPCDVNLWQYHGTVMSLCIGRSVHGSVSHRFRMKVASLLTRCKRAASLQFEYSNQILHNDQFP